MQACFPPTLQPCLKPSRCHHTVDLTKIVINCRSRHRVNPFTWMSSLVLPLSKIDYLPHFVAEGTEAYGPQGASDQREPRPICV